MDHLVARTSLNVSKLLNESKARKILVYLWGPKLNTYLLHKETYFDHGFCARMCVCARVCGCVCLCVHVCVVVCVWVRAHVCVNKKSCRCA